MTTDEERKGVTMFNTYYNLGEAAWNRLTPEEQREVIWNYRETINVAGLREQVELLRGTPGPLQVFVVA
jgi:hypothetical protein